jgi:hypothetical protein
MMNKYPSGRPRVHVYTTDQVLKDAIVEYREKIDDGTLSDVAWFEELIIDLHSELSIRAMSQVMS